jgi:hypothetical protein
MSTTVDETPDLSRMPAYVRERWPAAIERAERKVSSAEASPAVEKLVQAAQRASTARQRVVWLHRAADAWATPLQAVSACREGCSHCCHIPVTISHVEADLIGRATGRALAQPAKTVRLDPSKIVQGDVEALARVQEREQHTPCPFLAADRCDVYAVRPMACRWLLNLDDDDLLCRLVEGTPIPVPYADSRHLKALYLLAQPGAELADIRDFFP